MKNKGFTLIELIIVIVLMGIVGIITIPALMESGTTSKEKIKTSKIEAIKVAAKNYIEDNINQYSYCNSLNSQEGIASECTIAIDTLIEDNYLDADKNEDVIIDPTTDEKMAGTVLACYNMNTGTISTEYYENMENTELCAETGVHTLALQDNSVAISYHEGIDFYTNIFALGEFIGNFTLSKTEDNGVQFEIINNKQLHVRYSKQNGIFEGSVKTASTTITGEFNTSNGTEIRSVTFSAYIYDEIDEKSSQLSITIKPNDKLGELSDFKKDITLTCVQKNEYGCEINVGHFNAYFGYVSINGYEYINKYSLNNPVTSRNENYTGLESGKTYRIYNTETAPQGVLSLKDKSVLYINIVPSPKTLTFDAQGGTVSPTKKTVVYGDIYGDLPTPTKTGYTFNGWYETTAYTKEIKSSTKVEKIIDHTIYAKWVVNKYNIAFNGNGATSGSMSNLTNREYDKQYTLTSNAYARTGYTFGGWNTAANGSGTSYSNGASVKNLTSTNGATVTLYAKWTPIKYTIAFSKNASDATGSMSNLTNREYGTSYTLTSNGYTRAGYTFNEWNTAANGSGTSYSNGASVKNLTTTSGGTVYLYAQWTPIKYTIAFNKNASDATGSMSDLTNREYGTSYNLTSNAYSRVGYTFGGWNTKSDGSDTSYSNGASIRNLTTTNGATVTLYAKWTPIKYRIYFYGNSYNSGSTSNMSNLEYGTTYSLNANGFVKTGHVFKNWNTKSDGSGTSYVNKASIKNLTTISGGAVYLYAQWEKIKYTIAFNGNGATSGSMSNMTNRYYDSTYTLTSNAFKKSGYLFKGWNTAANGSGTSYEDEASVKNLTTTSDATVTLYAQWQEAKIGSVVRNSGQCTSISGSNNPCYYMGAQDHNYVSYINSSGITRLFRMYYADNNIVKMVTDDSYLPSAPYAMLGSWNGNCANTGLRVYYYLGDSEFLHADNGYTYITNFDENGRAYGKDFYVNRGVYYRELYDGNGNPYYLGEPLLMGSILNNFYSKYMNGSSSKVFTSFSDLDPLGAKTRSVSLMTTEEYKYVSGYKTNGTYSCSSAPHYGWLFDKAVSSTISNNANGEFKIYNYRVSACKVEEILSISKLSHSGNSWTFDMQLYGAVYPTVAVKANARISSGNGTYSNPYIMKESDQ